MKHNLKTLIASSMGLLVAISIPTTVLAATNTHWTTSTKLYEVRTWAGQSELGHGNGSLGDATFFHPRSAAALPNGELLISDSSNHLLRTVSVDSVSAYAGLNLGEDEANLPFGGYNDAELAKAAFDRPSGLAVDAQGNVYVADTKNNAIRKISKDGKVTTLAGNGTIGAVDGDSSKATFYEPSDVAVDSKGNVYVADTLNHVIRKITSAGTVTTLTSPSTRVGEYHPGAVEAYGDFQDGAILTAKFNEPSGLAIDAKDNLYVSDRGNQRIRYMDFAAGTVSTIAGGGAYASKQAIYVEGDFVDGIAAASRLNAPEGLTVTTDGSVVFADSLNHAIRMIKNGIVSTLAGVPTEPGTDNGVTSSAQFNHPTDVTVLKDGRLVIVDEFGNKVRLLQKYAKPASLPTEKGVSVVLNGALVHTEVPAQLQSNAVLLPIRDVGKSLGYDVNFDKKTGNALLTKGDTVYMIAKGMNTVTKSVNGKNETLSLNATTIAVNDRLFLPVRFFATESDMDIQWDAESQVVVIRDKVF